MEKYILTDDSGGAKCREVKPNSLMGSSFQCLLHMSGRFCRLQCLPLPSRHYTGLILQGAWFAQVSQDCEAVNYLVRRMSIGLRFIQKLDHLRKKPCLQAAILADLQKLFPWPEEKPMTASRPCAFGWESDTGEWRAHGQLLKPVTCHVASGLGVASHPEV